MLRIISMFLIIMHHCTMYGLGQITSNTMNRSIAGVTILGGKLGVDIYILIAGYYMCQSRFTGKKLVRLWGEVFFYAAGIYAVLDVLKHLGYREVLDDLQISVYFGWKPIRDLLLPIGSRQYWFFTCYIIIMLLSPILNLVIERLEQKRLLGCLILTTMMWSSITTSNGYDYYYNELIWLLIVYLYGGYIRRYSKNTNVRRSLCIAGVAFLGMVIDSELCIAHNGGYYSHVVLNAPLTLLCAVSLFLAFIKMRPRTNHLINTIAGTTFGVYLIHANLKLNPFLWNYMFGMPESVVESRYMLCYAILAVVLVFVVCAVIDQLRQATVEKWYMQMVDRIEPVAQVICQHAADALCGIWSFILQ